MSAMRVAAAALLLACTGCASAAGRSERLLGGDLEFVPSATRPVTRLYLWETQVVGFTLRCVYAGRDSAGRVLQVERLVTRVSEWGHTTPRDAPCPEFIVVGPVRNRARKQRTRQGG